MLARSSDLKGGMSLIFKKWCVFNKSFKTKASFKSSGKLGETP